MGTVIGTSGNEILKGDETRPGDGSLTILIGNAGNDTIMGFAGYWNVASYETSPSGTLVNLVTSRVNDGFGTVDTLIDVVAIRGSNYSDTLHGTFGSSWTVLEGMAGADIIYGKNNVANGVSYSLSPAGVTVDLAAGIATDGWGSADTLIGVRQIIGSAFADGLTGADSDDWFSASMGSDTIDGAGGSNTLDYSTLSGALDGGARVTLTGNGAGTTAKRNWAATDTLDSFTNIQTVKGTHTADRLTGWAGATQDVRLYGLTGNDTIDGAKNLHNILDYNDSPSGVVVRLQTSMVGSDWFGMANDGHGSTDTLKNVVAVQGSRRADSIAGSGANDWIAGGFGNDTLDGGAGVDTAAYSFSSSQATWSKNPDGTWSVRANFETDQLRNIEFLSFTDGLVHLPETPRDLDGNGRSDILFANDAMTSMGWTHYSTTRFQLSGGTLEQSYLPEASLPWSIAGTADFDGDGKADLLWHDPDGQIAIWLMDGASYLGGATIYTPPTGEAWDIAGTGDFNRDGRADILYSRDIVSPDDGKTYTHLVVWQMDGLTPLSSTPLSQVEADWTISGVADFNGDGYADLLWRHTSGAVSIWMLDGTGTPRGDTVAVVDTEWSIADTGDFNGDGKADILWRADTGEAAVWLMDGTTLLDGSTLSYNPGTAWNIVQVGDFNGDGKSDILWRSDPAPVTSESDITVWLMDGLNVMTDQSLGRVTADWQVV